MGGGAGTGQGRLIRAASPSPPETSGGTLGLSFKTVISRLSCVLGHLEKPILLYMGSLRRKTAETLTFAFLNRFGFCHIADIAGWEG